jgi:uncharacterized protein (DUF58 family)
MAEAIVWAVKAARVAAARMERLWRLVTSVVTALGWSLAVLIVVAFTAGYALGWIEAIVIAWSGVGLAALGSLYLVGRTAFDIRLAMPADRVVVGDKAVGEVTIVNPGRSRIASVRIEVPVGHGLAEFAMPALARGNSFQDVFLVPTSRRGIVPVGPVRTVRADPIGLLRRELVWSHPIDLYVHPYTVPIPSVSTGFIRDLEGEPTRELTSSDVAFHSLREYVPGDEQRNIHWKSTAKTGSFMVRQYEETKRSHLMVALSLAEADFSDEDEFELAVSVAGSLGVRAIRDSRTIQVVASAVTGEFAKHAVHEVRTLNALSRARLLDDLAGVEWDANALRLRELATVAAENSASTSIAFLICGSTVTSTQLRLASSEFGNGVTVLAVVCESGAVPTVRRVGQVTVVTIGYLEDLQNELARRSQAA